MSIFGQKHKKLWTTRLRKIFRKWGVGKETFQTLGGGFKRGGNQNFSKSQGGEQPTP